MSFSLSLAALAPILAVSPNADWQPTLRPAAALDGPVHRLHLHPGPGGLEFIAAGSFQNAGPLAANRIARRAGAGWVPLGTGFDDEVYALASFDDGMGTDLYAGGRFTTADGLGANLIARWDGVGWTSLGSGIERSGGGTTYVADLIAFDDGSGPSLFACGWFDTAGGNAAFGIARWDGVTWHAVGGGIPGLVFDLEVFDDGTGPALYAAGAFYDAGSAQVLNVARWDGAAWSAVGGELAGGVNSICVFDDGTGPALYAGGTFTSTMTAPEEFDHVARFDGSVWRPVGGGVQGPYGAKVNVLTVYDDGTGPALYAGGLFFEAGGLPADNIARFDGAVWSPLGAGVNGRLDTLVVAPGPIGGRALYVGGDFDVSPRGDAYFARLQP
ncbi:MAG: hypothetical protein AAF726_23160 [Planctomycetota bacterium]